MTGDVSEITFDDINLIPDAPGVYCISFKNGKKYVGKTSVSLRKRLMFHRAASLRGGTNQPVHSALRSSVGATISIIAHGHHLLDKDVSDIEVIKITALKLDGVGLYNVTAGGDGTPGFSHSRDAKRKMSESAKKSWTPERRAKSLETFAKKDVKERLVSAQKRSWTKERRASHSERMIKNSPSRKLSEEDVILIQARLNKCESCASISREYGVTPEAISAIKTGKNWSRITGIKHGPN